MPAFDRFFPSLFLVLCCLSVSVGAFTGGLWAALGIGGGVLVYVGLWAQNKKTPPLPRALVAFVMTTLWILAAELPVSSNGTLSIRVWINLASIFLPLLLLTAPQVHRAVFSRRFVPVVSVAMGIGAVALGVELLSGGVLLHWVKKPTTPLSEYNRGISHTVLMLFPLCAGLWIGGRKREALVLALLLLFPASLTQSRTAKLALIAGSVCTVASFYAPRWVRRCLNVGAVALAGVPFLVQALFVSAPELMGRLQNSWRHRVEIWDYLSYRIAEKPFLGWGLGTTKTLDFTQPHGALYRFAIEPAPHAHNFIVQTWVETGIPGLMMLVLFMLWILRRIGKMEAALVPFAQGCFAAAVVVGLFGFDFWTDALWGAFALTACVFGMLQQSLKRPLHGADV